ncbi:hypothetical protein SDC49_06245 [Lactobacillus sp. R2/2]|nr:hypothetical protein [Lactobacillus sp. R2/2]
MISRSSKVFNIEIEPQAAHELARRSRELPE